MSYADMPRLHTDATWVDQMDALIANRRTKPEAIAGLRVLAMHHHAMSTLARADECRGKRICQMGIFDYPPAGDKHSPGSRQDLQATMFAINFGKLNSGDTADYRITGRHKDVRIAGRAPVLTAVSGEVILYEAGCEAS